MRYQAGASVVHSWNPVTKLSLVLTLVVTAFAVPLLWWPVLLLALVFGLAVLAGVQRRFLTSTARFLLPVIVLLFLIQGLFHPGGYAEGLLFAARTALRLLVLTGSFLFLLLTTHPGELMTSLVARGMPPKISYVVSATLQIVPAFQQRAQGILQAQRARGLRVGGGPISRVRALVPLVSPLVLGALSDVDERAIAMEARAFGSTARRTSYTVIPDSLAQRVARWAMLVVAVAAIALSTTGVLA